MLPDSEGFLYPEILNDECVGCGACLAACPMGNKEGSRVEVPYERMAFAAFSLDDKRRSLSSSGGVFPILADLIFSKGGRVYGAAFSGDFKRVCHVGVDNADDLGVLQGSKYLQSDVGDSYRMVKGDLEDGLEVLFSGTPCQVAGLLSYLGKEYENLYTQDIACHGVASPLVWEVYAKMREESTGASLVGVSFRDKSDSWRDYSVRLDFSNGVSLREIAKEQEYMQCYLKGLSLRPSCYFCEFKGENSRGDLLLADCWGVHRFLPKMYDDRGTSLVVLESEKGEGLWGECSTFLKQERLSYREAISENPALVKPSRKPICRLGFMRSLRKDPEMAIKKWGVLTKFDVLAGKVRWYKRKLSSILSI